MSRTITMAELNRLATEEMERRYKELGITRPIRPAGFATALRGKARQSAEQYLDNQMRRG